MQVFSILNLCKSHTDYKHLRAFHELSKQITPILLSHSESELNVVLAVDYIKLAKELKVTEAEAVDLLGVEALSSFSHLLGATEARILEQGSKDLRLLFTFTAGEAQDGIYFDDEKLLEVLEVWGVEMFSLVSCLIKSKDPCIFSVKEAFERLKVKSSYQVQFCILRDRFINQFNKRMKGRLKINVKRLYRGVVEMSIDFQ